MPRNRHSHTQSLTPDMAAYVRDLEAAAFSLEDALIEIQSAAPCDYPKANLALQEFARVQREAREVYSV